MKTSSKTRNRTTTRKNASGRRTSSTKKSTIALPLVTTHDIEPTEVPSIVATPLDWPVQISEESCAEPAAVADSFIEERGSFDQLENFPYELSGATPAGFNSPVESPAAEIFQSEISNFETAAEETASISPADAEISPPDILGDVELKVVTDDPYAHHDQKPLRATLAKYWSRIRQGIKIRPVKKRLRVCETVSLGEKRFIAVVQVDQEQFLVGGSPTSISMLAHLEDSPKFSDVLRQHCELNQNPA
jgi:hypothetical protein